MFEVNAGDQDIVVAGNVGSVDNGMQVTVYGHIRGNHHVQVDY